MLSGGSLSPLFLDPFPGSDHVDAVLVIRLAVLSPLVKGPTEATFPPFSRLLDLAAPPLWSFEGSAHQSPLFCRDPARFPL